MERRLTVRKRRRSVDDGCCFLWEMCFCFSQSSIEKGRGRTVSMQVCFSVQTSLVSTDCCNGFVRGGVQSPLGQKTSSSHTFWFGLWHLSVKNDGVEFVGGVQINHVVNRRGGTGLESRGQPLAVLVVAFPQKRGGIFGEWHCFLPRLTISGKPSHEVSGVFPLICEAAGVPM